MTDSSQASPRKPVKIAPPTGTRDFYPREMLVRRYITDAWRRTALRHGFDEIDGPTFESAELYKVKSGEGILSEMFGTYSGKSPDDVEAVKRGEPPFGLRPEFTPTLARMYAARAKQLPQPTKWFCVSNFFRAERPQRGRLREFWQWNCDVIGNNVVNDESSSEGQRRSRLGNSPDDEVLDVMVSCLTSYGFSSETAQLRMSDRRFFGRVFAESGLDAAGQGRVIAALDKFGKVSEEQFAASLQELGLSLKASQAVAAVLNDDKSIESQQQFDEYIARLTQNILLIPGNEARPGGQMPAAVALLRAFCNWTSWGSSPRGYSDWIRIDPTIVRGLAYYTGTVFEVIAEGERAVAGGGRYDNLIELFGGPPTPACGFGMGDAVLGNLLEDRKLIPEGRDMLEALARPMPYRPDVFVIASPNEGCEELIVPTVARLRRGEESEKYKQGETKPWSPERYLPGRPPLHARRSYKATKNVGKLLADASACHARFAAIIESPESCTLKNLDSGVEDKAVPLADLASRVPPHA